LLVTKINVTRSEIKPFDPFVKEGPNSLLSILHASRFYSYDSRGFESLWNRNNLHRLLVASRHYRDRFELLGVEAEFTNRISEAAINKREIRLKTIVPP